MISYRQLSYAYPHQSNDVLKSINCRVKKGQALLVTGPSGCGKSTFMRAANGLVPHFYQGDLRGEIAVNGVDVRAKTIPALAADVGSLFQDPEQQFFTLDVESEIAFSHEQRGVEPEKIRATVREIAARLKIEHVLDSSIFSLSEGEKQKTALAATLSLYPDAVLLDEPTANLDHDSTLRLATFVKELKAAGMAIIVVDHRLYWLEGIIDEVLIMQEGGVAERGPFAMLYDRELRECYGLRHPDIGHLESTIDELPGTEAWTDEAIRVNGLTFAYRGKPPLFVERNFCFPLAKVTAVVGSNGRGKTTLARVLTGLNKLQAGTVTIGTEQVTSQQLRRRSGLVFQNSDHQLFMNSVEREMTVAGMKHPKAERSARAAELLRHFNLHDFAAAHPQSLSGGQKQRLVIACALMKEPDILILDEPTSGLDGKNLKIIAETLKQIAVSRGTCVIVITHDLELIVDSCDYVINLDTTGDTE